MRFDRLHILWEFLTTEKIPGREWDFSFVNSTGDKHEKFNCGTAGCLIGEIPVIWKELKFSTVNRGITYKGLNSFDSVVEFFEINLEEARQLFNYKDVYVPEIPAIYYKSKSLKESSTRPQIAANLKKFIIKASNNELYSQKE